MYRKSQGETRRTYMEVRAKTMRNDMEFVFLFFFVMTYRNRDKEHNNNRPGGLKVNNHFQKIRKCFGKHLLSFLVSTFL